MTKKRTKKTAVRRSRIQLSVTQDEETLIRLGAKCRGENLSQFTLKSARSEAEIVLGDQTQFELSPMKFADFKAALARPAKVVPALQKLFSRSRCSDNNRDIVKDTCG